MVLVMMALVTIIRMIKVTYDDYGARNDNGAYDDCGDDNNKDDNGNRNGIGACDDVDDSDQKDDTGA